MLDACLVEKNGRTTMAGLEDKWHGSPLIDGSNGHGILIGNRSAISIDNRGATSISNHCAISIDNRGARDSTSVVLC